MDFIFSKSSETCLKMDHYATCSRRGLVFENVCVGLNANVVFIPLIIIVIISSTLQEMKTTLGSPDPTTWT